MKSESLLQRVYYSLLGCDATQTNCMCSTLNITVAAPSEMFILVYQTVRRHVPHAEIPEASCVLPSLLHIGIDFKL